MERLYFEAPQAVIDKIEQADVDALLEMYGLDDLQAAPMPGAGRRFVKRLGDILMSALAIVVLAVPMLVVALAIYIDDPGRVVFVQKRVGRGGKRFRFYKFRTMKENTPKYLSTMELEDPAQYVTRLGRFLRRFSLDELPQLFNVLRGDMSLVGPRPLIADEYEVHQMRARLGVYNVRPGLTGLAQVNGRDFCSVGDKVRWDVKYVENFGPMQDIHILLSTLPKVFGAADVADGPDAAHGHCADGEEEA